MATAKATLSNFRQAPRKMRLVANLVTGKKVSDALINLEFTTKKASLPIKTLIQSALANAKAMDIPTENLIIKKITVNAGKILYRSLPAARGSAHRMRKRTSIVCVELGEPEVKKIEKIKKEKVISSDTDKKNQKKAETGVLVEEKKTEKKTTKKTITKKTKK